MPMLYRISRQAGRNAPNIGVKAGMNGLRRSKVHMTALARRKSIMTLMNGFIYRLEAVKKLTVPVLGTKPAKS